MIVHSYPLLLSLYKGEGRILIVPLIDHVAGYSINADWFVSVSDTNNAIAVGDGVIAAVDFIKNSPLSSLTPKEREENAAWKKNTKYKSKVTFWKNNHYVRIKITEDEQYIVHSMKKSEKRQGAYADIIKEIILPADAEAEEIGKSVIDVFIESEIYYKNCKESDKENKKEIELLDGTKLTMIPPQGKYMVDFGDCGSAEIYQCYKYLPQDSVDSLADIFIGIASELDCDLGEENICDSWQDIYGKADCFCVKEVSYGIFRLRAEMKNENLHKLSYYKQMTEDLLLECSIEIHQPNRRKKLVEEIEGLFDKFVLSCKL